MNDKKEELKKSIKQRYTELSQAPYSMQKKLPEGQKIVSRDCMKSMKFCRITVNQGHRDRTILTISSAVSICLGG